MIEHNEVFMDSISIINMVLLILINVNLYKIILHLEFDNFTLSRIFNTIFDNIHEITEYSSEEEISATQ